MKAIFLLGLFAIIILLGIFLFYLNPVSKSQTSTKENLTPFSSLTPSQFNEAMSSGNYIVIDIRTIDEYKEGHLKNAKQSDYYQAQEFSKYLDSLDKKANYLIYCGSGRRSIEALKIMRYKEFANVYDLSGGYKAWLSAELPVEK